VASAEATRGAGLFLIMLNGIYAGGHDRQKTTPASAAAAAAVVFSVNYLSPPAGMRKPRTAIRKGQAGCSGLVGAAAPGLTRLICPHPLNGAAELPTQNHS